MSHESAGQCKKDEHPNNTGKESTPAVHVEDLHRMESRLLKLLDDFNSDNMLSFGPNCPYEKLNAIRDKQEELMRLHFEQDKKVHNAIDSSSRRGHKPFQPLISDEGWKTTKANVDNLLSKLELLSIDIDNLHQANRPDLSNPRGS
ncbi:Coiled-coil domain-containing protein 28B [Paragonimus heterotremus]|uniref:Coiled-coil domain-containing protein 28B n=1 Tax=Paragonimus heterotremus TaxID=100268 RepID=A0A8J4T8J0_9TREM|nr:Coiled-coil domain-containing protein 28B [Paragonimus heterotremus]